MKKRYFVHTLVTVWLAAGVIAGCAGAGETQPAIPQETLLAENTPGPSPEATRPGAATATPTLMPPAAPSPAPRATVRSPARQPSGWAIYSNPDFVQGIDLHENHLWAATLGGVVDWDLESSLPKVYTTRDGLVEIQANDLVICPMPQLRVLVSHDSGVLSAYDLELKKWGRVPITFNDGSTLKGVSALFCDEKNNRLLVGSAGGLGILDFKTDRWRFVGPEQGLKVETIKAIDVVGQSIWIAAGPESAFMVIGSSVFPFNGSSGFPSGSVNDLSVGLDMSIWLGYPTGLVQYKDKRWNSFGNQVSNGIPFVSIDVVEAGIDNIIWIASEDEGICPFDLTTKFCSTIYPAPRGVSITDLKAAENGITYAATHGNGILVLERENRSSLQLNSQKLISNDILDIAESPDGKLWIATGHGVNFFDLGRPVDVWQYILPSRSGLVQERVSGLEPVSGGMWFLYDQAPEVSLLNGDQWSKLSESEGLLGSVNDTEIDQLGYVWFATDLGINVWDGTTMRAYGPDTGLPGNVFNALLEQSGVMWVGTDLGLLKSERFQWKMVLPSISVYAIVPYTGSQLLLGTDQGLILYDGSQSFQWVINMADKIFMDLKITSLALDRLGNLWVGTQDDGLFYYNGSTWEQFDTTKGLPTNHIRKVFADHLGAVWAATTTGNGGGALVRFLP